MGRRSLTIHCTLNPVKRHLGISEIVRRESFGCSAQTVSI